jgi:bacterioferritin-associated ferredoxin
MYVCICHALNERSVRAAVRNHRPARVSDVYRCLSVEPRCGKGAGMIRDILVEEGLIAARADDWMERAS